ncbi:MAG: FIST signal transduction protein [Pseudomonadota bacterium]
MLTSVVIHVEDPSPAHAAPELAERAVAEWPRREPPAAALLFVSGALEPAAHVHAVRDAFPGIRLIGCSSDGEMSSTLGHHTDSAVLMLFGSDRTRFEPFVCRCDENWKVNRPDSGDAGDALETATVGLMFAEAISGTDGETIMRQVQADLGPEVPLFGALAADDWEFRRTYQFIDDEVLQGAAVGLLFHGPLAIGYGLDSGWSPLGPSVRIDVARGSRVERIDGVPATDYYDGLVGRSADINGSYPLMFRQGVNRYLRAPLRQEDDSILFAGAVPEGVEAQVACASPKAILGAARRSAEDAAAMLKSPPDAVVLFSCAARHYVLGTQTRREIDEAMAAFEGEPAVAGMYGYGEIAPLRSSRGHGTLFHNETFVCLALREMTP